MISSSTCEHRHSFKCVSVLCEPDVYLVFGSTSPAAFEQIFGYLCLTPWQRSVDKLRLMAASDARRVPHQVLPHRELIQ